MINKHLYANIQTLSDKEIGQLTRHNDVMRTRFNKSVERPYMSSLINTRKDRFNTGVVGNVIKYDSEEPDQWLKSSYTKYHCDA